MLVKENNWAVSITGKLVIQMKRIQNGVQSVENYQKESKDSLVNLAPNES